ncbi:hypothetical protein [Anatilimnocola floriformis]|uniref:hypothetical protein n=1 Tax=Anatilimnocola floriformis TaxID=2948575 RepID=UPI0020C2622D|nr:hypothetical protein [Anatilimnocola floriformis]
MPLIACPECQRQVSDQAPACPQCGFPLAVRLPQTVVPPPVATRVSLGSEPSPLQEIAYRQKLLLYALLITILSQLPIWYCFQTTWLWPLGILGFLGNAAFGVWCFFKLGRALEMSVHTIAFFAVGLFFPCISLAVMYVFTNRATSALQMAGIKVGLLGANLSTVP